MNTCQRLRIIDKKDGNEEEATEKDEDVSWGGGAEVRWREMLVSKHTTGRWKMNSTPCKANSSFIHRGGASPSALGASALSGGQTP